MKRSTFERENRITLPQNRLYTLFHSRWIFGGLLVVLSFFTLYLIHGKVLVAPNNYMLSTKGESGRVYYTLASHAKSDSTYVNFQGMNYPFGEHLVYCDAQPLVTNSFRFVAKVFPGIVDKAVGVQNLLSFYALIVGALLLYLFLLRWNLPPWYSAFSAFALMLLGPQILRMPWQPSLAYAFYIPLLLVLFQSYFKSRSWKIVAVIFLVNLFGFFINPYLGMIGSGIFAVVALVLGLKEKWKHPRPYLKSLLHVLIPGVLYQLYVATSDSRTDRIGQPTGLHEFTSSFGSVFTSPHSPAKPLYETLGVDMTDVLMHFEGMSYIGLFFNVLLMFFIGRWIYQRFTRKKRGHILELEHKTLLFVAIAFLILAMGIPFTLHSSFESLLDVFKPLKQLRALGRMAWTFTFCLDLVLLYLLYQFLEQNALRKSQKTVGVALTCAFLAFTVWEGIELHQEIVKEQVEGNVFVSEKLESDAHFEYVSQALDSIDASRYCALVPLPYYHVGSEQFATESHTSYRAMLESIAFAYHTELPLTSCYLSRISREESIRALQFFAPTFMEKKIANDFKDERPLLLFRSKLVEKISENEKQLLRMGTVVYESDYIALVELEQDVLWKTNGKEMLASLEEFKTSYRQFGNLYCFGDVPPIHLDFDHGEFQTEIAINGGAFECSEVENEYFFDEKRDATDLPSGQYELSFWGETSENRTQAQLILEKFDLKGNLISSEVLDEAKRSSAYWKNWLRWKWSIEFSDTYTVKLRMKQPSNSPGFFIDELMLLPERSSVFTKCNENLWLWNNFVLDLTKEK